LTTAAGEDGCDCDYYDDDDYDYGRRRGRTTATEGRRP
jgi:hypothetical protein